MIPSPSREKATPPIQESVTVFLASPPEGTPVEVLALLRGMTASPDSHLPPEIFFETVEQSPIAISITDSRATILYVNRAFELLTGYPREEALGQNESVLSSKHTPATIYQQLWHTIQSKKPWSGTLVNRTREGEEYLASLTIAPVLDEQKEVAYFLGIHRDVTREYELETQLRQQKGRVETVLDAAPILIALIEASGRVVLDNHEYKKLLGDLRGREPVALLRRALVEQADVDPLEALAQGKSFRNIEISLEIPGSRGVRWYACSGTPTNETSISARTFFERQGCGENHLLLLADDITARRREVERAHLENLRARLAEQQTTLVMREALAAAIFQMRGPLNIIEAALGMLKRGRGDSTTLASMLAQISASGQQALTTLQSALPEELPEMGTSVNVNELLRQVVEIQTDRLLANGIVVDWRPATVLPELTGQRTQLRSLFKHLIDNAICALDESRRPQRELRVVTRGVDDAVEVEIQDNGPGIQPDHRFKAFEPFFIGWRERRGHSGMGLPLAQEIINQHGGTIFIDPDFDQGCRIRLTLCQDTADRANR